MRIDCPHCFHKAVITSSNALSTSVKDIYCQCTNLPDCGASFVSTLSHKHDLSPPIKSVQDLAVSVLRSMTPQDRKTLMQSDMFNQ